jgi:hypothetical protein
LSDWPSVRQQLVDAEAFFAAQHGRLVILDEVQRVPELFAVLRGVIDQRRQLGEAAGQFLLLGSAPTVSRGFYEAAKDVNATRRLLVAPVPNSYPGREVWRCCLL